MTKLPSLYIVISHIHRHNGRVLGVGDSEVLLLYGHQLHLVLRDPLLVSGLKCELQYVWAGAVRGQGDDVILGGAPHHLAHALHVHTETDRPLALELVKTLGLEADRHEADVGRVHGLEPEAGGVTVPGALPVS